MLSSSCKITTTTFTIECWVKLREDAGSAERYFIMQNVGTNHVMDCGRLAMQPQ